MARSWRPTAAPRCWPTVVFEKKPKPGLDFFPLTVNYQEKAFAAGKIPGGFFKREGRPSEKEVLTSRLIDRPIRPLFHESYRNETLVVGTDAGARPGERSRHRGDDRHVGRSHDQRRAVHGSDRRRPRRLPRRQVRRQSDPRPDRAEHARPRRRRHQGRRADGRVRGQGAARGRHAERRHGGPSFLPAGDRRHHPARRALRQGSAAAHRAVGSVQDRGRQAQVRDAGQAGRGLWRDAEARPPDQGRRGQDRSQEAVRGQRRSARRLRRAVRQPRSRRRAQRHPRHRQAHRRPRHQDRASDRGRGRRAAARPRLVAVHPRRDPGAGRGHARHRPGRADHRRARGRVPRALHAALQLPSLLGGRSAPHGLARPARDRPRQARLARAAPDAAQQGEVPVHDPRRVGDHREQRLVLDGLGVRRFAGADGCRACRWTGRWPASPWA